MIKFSKYHGLGNDYIVIHPDEFRRVPGPEIIRRICHRHYGIGSDGILYGPIQSRICDFGLRIFNPDGSEAEKSGNGLRIFARSLWDEGRVKSTPFTVETPGGAVRCEINENGRSIQVDMGEVCFNSKVIPVAGEAREVLNETISLDGQVFTFCAATVGNPHCVVMTDYPTPELAKQFGPGIETDTRFPNRINVQFMKVMDRKNIQIEIWERGAGYTLASGSSSIAAAAVAYRLGFCDSDITVHMPGGSLSVRFRDGYFATLTGPVARICTGELSEELIEESG